MTDVPATSAVARISPGGPPDTRQLPSPSGRTDQPARQRQPVWQDVEATASRSASERPSAPAEQATKSICRMAPSVPIARSAERMPGLKEELVHGAQQHPARLGELVEGLGRRRVRRERLLDQHRDAGLDRQPRDRVVRREWRADVEHLDPVRAKRMREIGLDDRPFGMRAASFSAR